MPLMLWILWVRWEIASRCKSILGCIGLWWEVLVYADRLLILVGWRRGVVVDCRFHIAGGVSTFSTFPEERHREASDSGRGFLFFIEKKGIGRKRVRKG